MDAEWLCDEEMDRQEEEYRQECHAAAHDFLVQSFLPEVDAPPEEDFHAPPDEHDLPCIDAQVYSEGNSSMARSTLPVPATEGLQALTPKREAHGAARQFTCDDASEVLLPEQTGFHALQSNAWSCGGKATIEQQGLGQDGRYDHRGDYRAQASTLGG